MTRYVLSPRPPVRAFLIAAVLAAGSAALLVVSLSSGWPLAVAITGGVGLALAVGLVALALASLRSMRLVVTLEDDGYRIVGPGVDEAGHWSDVTKVVSTDDGARLVVHRGEVERTYLWCPGGGADPQMKALVADVARRLDADRGYGAV